MSDEPTVYGIDWRDVAVVTYVVVSSMGDGVEVMVWVCVMVGPEVVAVVACGD